MQHALPEAQRRMIREVSAQSTRQISPGNGIRSCVSLLMQGKRLHAEQFLQVQGSIPSGGMLRHHASLVRKERAAGVARGVRTTHAHYESGASD